MAIKLFRVALVSLAVVFLGSCSVLQYIFGSVFPATLTLAKAEADLSGDIDSNSAQSFSVRVVETAGKGYVVLEGNLATQEKQFFFYDLDLNFKRSLTLLSTAGNGVIVDSGGAIDAGGTRLDPATLAPAVPPTGNVVSNNGYSGNDGYAYGAADYFGFNFQMGTSILNYMAGATPTSSLALSATMSNLQLDALFDESPGDPAGSIMFVVSQSNNNNNNSDDATRYFMRVTKTEVATGFTSSTGILDTAPRRDKLQRDSLGFADGSVMAYDNGSSSYVRVDPTDASTQASLYSTSSKDGRFAYRTSGGEFYGFDRKSRILTKYVAWW
jgi:hypothetical protein